MILQAVELAQTRGQTCLTSRNRFPPEEGQGVGERGGGATVASSDRGFTGVWVARVQGRFRLSSGTHGLQAASAGEVGTERQEGGDRGVAEARVELERVD